MTENEKKAAGIIQRHEPFRTGVSWHNAAGAAGALSAAGLLRTELDDRSSEACKAMAQECERENRGVDWYEPAGRTAILVGRDILAAEKPVERWTVQRSVSGGWDAKYIGEYARCSVRFPSDAEPEARAYVARKNKEGK